MARLPRFARELQRATTFDDLLAIAREELVAATGYQHAWMYVRESDDAPVMRLVSAIGGVAAVAWDQAPTLPITGDAMLEEIMRGEEPVVVVDARTDPRTDKAMVAAFGNRTIVNVPLRLVDRPFGAFGTGTIGDEPCRAPTADELDYLTAMCAQLVVAAGRIRLQEERRAADRRERELEHQLVRAQRLESLAVLAGGVAHDFNNLITGIIASVALARRRAGSNEDLDAIEGAARRGQDLTRQLLALSRAQALSVQSVDLEPQLRELLALLRRVLPDNVVVEVRSAASVPLVRVDRTMLDQVLLNLCVNARDAMPHGGRLVLATGTIDVTAGSPLAGQLEPGRYATISVADTGTGLAPAALERVFEPFFTTKPAGAGTGLGLAVAYGIVRQHAGTITCASEPGAGATFTIHLPADLAPASEPPAPAVADPAAGAARARGAHLLLVEDDAAVRRVTARLLEAAGYQVTVASDGETACARAADEPFDLAIVDMVMPGISGVETVERLRVARPGLPVIIASGYAPSSLALARLGRDAVELREKPYRPDELLATIDRMLARRGRR
jgi:signal transduction histidine kinase